MAHLVFARRMKMERALSHYFEWVRVNDPHASHRLPLLELADGILTGGEPASNDRRQALSAALEQWRYQALNERPRHTRQEDLELLDALDVASNQLAGREERPPRRGRAALADEDLAAGEETRALDAFDAMEGWEAFESRAQAMTRHHFGNRILLYAPLYLSSECINYCVYCGFRYPHAMERKHLSVPETTAQAEILRGRGFRHLLLVAGDFPSLTTVDYHVSMVRALADLGLSTAVEIAPQNTTGYARLAAEGVQTVTLYQETYNEQLYAMYHPRGSKVSYDWRFEALERALEGGIPRVGLGVLLGLEEPRRDLIRLIRHGHYLQHRFPECTLAFSLPRIHEGPEGFEVPTPVDDDTLVRLYVALRLAFPEAELVLSTREPPALRDRLAKICITQLSAGSCTMPGGYVADELVVPQDGQFPVVDHRGPADVAESLRQAGLQPTWELPT